MKNYYIGIYGVLIIAMIISVLLYFNVTSGDIKNLIGNIFCGLFTGAIISIVSNIKEVYIYKNNKKIEFLRDILDSIVKVLKMNAEMSEREKMNILEFAEILDEIDRIFKKISQIEYNELNEFIEKEKIDLSIGEKLEEEILAPLDGVLFINNNDIKKYEKKIFPVIMIQLRLKHIIKRKLEEILTDNDNLKRAII